MKISPRSLQKLLPSLSARLRTYHLQNLPQTPPPSSPSTTSFASTPSSSQSSREDAIELAELELRWMGEAAKDWAADVNSLRVDTKGNQDTLAGEGGEELLWKVRLREMVVDRVEKNKPLAYIIGNQPFHPLPIPLLVRPPTLIPRTETEFWINRLLSELSSLPEASGGEEYRILDIGTGTGCIALSMHHGLSSMEGRARETRGKRKVEVIGVDKEVGALELATENWSRLRAHEKAQAAGSSRPESAEDEPVRFLREDLFSDNFSSSILSQLRSPSPFRPSSFPHRPSAISTLGLTFNLVISNPPYIPRSEYKNLDPGVKDWEDRGALVGEVLQAEASQSEIGEETDDGLIFYKRIIGMAGELLGIDHIPPSLSSTPSALIPTTTIDPSPSSRPMLVFEVGHDQSEAVRHLIVDSHLFERVEIWKDPWGIGRCVVGWR